jgi:Tc toxin complex TcA C-terminal TcB-binding domain
MKIKADDLSYESSNSGRLAQFKRQLQDRIHQLNSAGHEVKSLDAQIKTQQQKVVIASQEITSQQSAIDHANEVYDFLRNKYSTVALHTWMDNRLQTLHYQLYTLAYQLAKKAERAYCFERGIDVVDANFISFGYWDGGHDGLLAGEALFQGLKRLEAAYHEDRGYDFEITRHISLRQLNPLALFQLRENSSCEIALPELLFDMDFPGHYMRRIKSVSLSIPCVVGPYTSISCTLRLLRNEYRVDPIATDKSSYPKTTDQDDTRFRSAVIPISAIAVSGAQNDSGLFEMNFKDERYIPFEGAGAISYWRIELPADFRQWDYGTMADVIMHVRYTSKDGGDRLKSVAAGAVADFVKDVASRSQEEGLFAMFDLRSEFANEWARASIAPPPGSSDPRKIALKGLLDRLPAYTKGRDPKKIIAVDVWLMLSPAANWVQSATLIMPDGANPSFTKGESTKGMVIWKNAGVNGPITDWTIQLTGSGTGMLTRGFVVVRFQMG